MSKKIHKPMENLSDWSLRSFGRTWCSKISSKFSITINYWLGLHFKLIFILSIFEYQGTEHYFFLCLFQSTSPQIIGSSSRYPDNLSNRIEDDNESLDTPSIIVPTPVDSDHTISSTSIEESTGYHHNHYSRKEAGWVECLTSYKANSHNRLLSSNHHLTVPGRQPPFRSLSELSARVSGREVTLNDDGTEQERRLDRQDTLEANGYIPEILTLNDDRQPPSKSTHPRTSPTVFFSNQSDPILSPDVVNDLTIVKRQNSPPENLSQPRSSREYLVDNSVVVIPPEGDCGDLSGRQSVERNGGLVRRMSSGVALHILFTLAKIFWFNFYS